MHSFVDHYLPAWFQNAVRSSRPLKVDFTDSRFVSVFPEQGRYVSNIVDWAEHSLLQVVGIEFNVLPDRLAEPDGRSLSQLRWTLLLQSLQRQPHSNDFLLSRVCLASWPSLTQLPENALVMAARLCALLARRPTTASVIPRLLGLPESQVFSMIKALSLHGHVQVSGASVTASPSEPDDEARPVASLIGRIWQRLLPQP